MPKYPRTRVIIDCTEFFNWQSHIWDSRYYTLHSCQQCIGKSVTSVLRSLSYLECRSTSRTTTYLPTCLTESSDLWLSRDVLAVYTCVLTCLPTGEPVPDTPTCCVPTKEWSDASTCMNSGHVPMPSIVNWTNSLLIRLFKKTNKQTNKQKQKQKNKKKQKKTVHLAFRLIPRVRNQYFQMIQSVSYGQEVLP